MKRIVILMMVLLGVGTASAGSWTLSGYSDYETSQAEVMFWPDPNGGIGAMVLSDSSIPEDSDDNLAVGLSATFRLDEVYSALVGTVLPSVPLPEDIPAMFYGRVGIAWETGNEHSAIGVIGTGLMLLPENAIQPTIWAEWIVPEGGQVAIDREIRTMFGVTIWF